jgi:hypothetical protein
LSVEEIVPTALEDDHDDAEDDLDKDDDEEDEDGNDKNDNLERPDEEIRLRKPTPGMHTYFQHFSCPFTR